MKSKDVIIYLKLLILISTQVLCQYAYLGAQSNNNGTTPPDAIEIDSEPQGAMVKISGKYIFIGRTPFVVPYSLHGRYKIQAKKDGYENASLTVNLFGDKNHKVTIYLSKKTRLKAAMRSTLLPGWGQFYGQGKIKSLVVIMGQTALGIKTFISVKKYRNKKNDYQLAIDEFNGAVGLEEVQKALKEAEDAMNFKTSMIYVTAGFWLYNILDSMVFFSSKSLPVRFSPGVANQINGAAEKKIMLEVKIDF